jgi:phage shock protein E
VHQRLQAGATIRIFKNEIIFIYLPFVFGPKLAEVSKINRKRLYQDKIIRTIMKLFLMTFLTAGLMSCASPQQGDGSVKTISATEYKAHHEKIDNQEVMLVDVRTPAEFEAGHLENTQHADFLSGQFEREIQNWDKDKTYYLYCATGNRSGKAAKLMEEAGFKDVYNIGGYSDLKAAGLPVKK